MTKNPFFENWMKPMMGQNTFPSIPTVMPYGMKEMMESGRKTIQAYSEAQQITAEGLQTIIQRQTEILSQLMQDSSAVAKEIMNEGTPEEKIARGAELIREAYEKNAHNLREVGDIANKSTRQAIDILNERIANSFEEIQSTAEEAKEKRSAKTSKKSA